LRAAIAAMPILITHRDRQLSSGWPSQYAHKKKKFQWGNGKYLIKKNLTKKKYIQDLKGSYDCFFFGYN